MTSVNNLIFRYALHNSYNNYYTVNYLLTCGSFLIVLARDPKRKDVIVYC